MDTNSIYVGCPSKWGNPYKTKFGRSAAIYNYEQYLLSSGLIHDIKELLNLKLFCHCAPLDCHADILIKYLYKLEINEC